MEQANGRRRGVRRDGAERARCIVRSVLFFFSSRRRHTRLQGDWSSDVCSSDLALGLQHVLVMYAGAVAVPLIVGRALNLPPEQVAHLISADLFCCGLITLIQAMGATQWFGIKLPVMMGVTFASVAPMVSMAQSTGDRKSVV